VVEHPWRPRPAAIGDAAAVRAPRPRSPSLPSCRRARAPSASSRVPAALGDVPGRRGRAPEHPSTRDQPALLVADRLPQLLGDVASEPPSATSGPSWSPTWVAPELLPDKAPVEVFIDFESLPEMGFQPVVVYGVLVKRGREAQYHQFVVGARTRRQLEHARDSFMLLVESLPSGAPLFHYAAHEKTLVVKIGGARASAVAQRLVDLFPIVRHGVALPVRSRSLKDVATALGLRRRSTVADGLEAAELWLRWTEDHTPALLSELLRYNRDDLDLLAGLLAKLRGAASAR
jgi:RNase H-like protein